MIVDKIWLEKKLRNPRVQVLLWNLKFLVFDVLFTCDDLFPNLAFHIPGGFKVTKNKRGAKRFVPIASDLSGEDILVLDAKTNEFYVYEFYGYRKTECNWFDPSDNVIKEWIQTLIHYNLESLKSGLFDESDSDVQDLRKILLELKELFK